MEKEIMDYAIEQGYSKKDLVNRKCNRCDTQVLKEKFDSCIDYPYYCPNCDENMFEFETKEIID